MPRILFSLAVSALTGLLAGSAPAGAVSVNFVAGTINSTLALSDYYTTGNTMAGMKVQVFFQDAGSETATWAITGSASGAATGTGWFLTESGDTSSAPWILVNVSARNISRVLMDAGSGNAVFDTYFSNQSGTDHSALGSDFRVTSGADSLNIIATYRDQVALTGQAPVGDLYRYLEISFPDTPFAAINKFHFNAATDSLRITGDLQPVPLPGAWLLLGSALLGLAGMGLRRRKD